MQRHVERRKHDLNVKKMWVMLEKLKDDLGMSSKNKTLQPAERASLLKRTDYSRLDDREVSRSSRESAYTKEFSTKAAPDVPSRPNETASTFPTTSENWYRDEEPLKRSFEDEGIKSNLGERYVDTAVRESSSVYETTSHSDQPRQSNQEDNLKSSSLQSILSTSSKIKVKPELNVYENRQEEKIKNETSGLKSYSASSLGSRTSAGSLQRRIASRLEDEPLEKAEYQSISNSPRISFAPDDLQSGVELKSSAQKQSIEAENKTRKSSLNSVRSSVKAVDSVYEQHSQKEIHGEEDSELKPHSISSLDSQVSTSRKSRASVDAVKVKPDMEERLHQSKTIDLKSHSVSSAGSRASVGSSRPSRANADKVALPQNGGSKSLVEKYLSRTIHTHDEFFGVIEPVSSTPPQSVEGKSRTSSRSSTRSFLKEKSSEIEANVEKNIQAEVSGLQANSASAVGSRISASNRSRGSIDSNESPDYLGSEKSFVKNHDDNLAITPKPSSRSADSLTYDELVDDSRVAKLDDMPELKHEDERKASISSNESSSRRSRRKKARSIELFGTRKINSKEDVAIETQSVWSLGSKTSAQSLLREKTPLSRNSSNDVKSTSIDDELKSPNSESVTSKSVFSEPSFLGDKTVLNGDLKKLKSFQQLVPDANIVRTPSESSLKSSTSTIKNVDQAAEIDLKEDIAEVNSQSVSSFGSITSANDLQKERKGESTIESLVEDLLPVSKKSQAVNLEDSLSRQSIQSDDSKKSASSIVAAPRRSIQARPRKTSETKPQPLSRTKRESKDSLIEEFSDKESSRNGSQHVLEDKLLEDDESRLTHDKKKQLDDENSFLEKREETSTRSFLDEIREAALSVDRRSSHGTDEESDYESIAALSMALKPGDAMKPFDVKPLTTKEDSGSKPRLTKQVAQVSTESAKDSFKEDILSNADKDDAYSDDFEDDDSDNF